MGCSIEYKRKVKLVFAGQGFKGKELKTAVDRYISNKRSEVLGSTGNIDTKADPAFKDEPDYEMKFDSVVDIADTLEAIIGVVGEDVNSPHNAKLVEQAKFIAEVLKDSPKLDVEAEVHVNQLAVSKGSYDMEADKVLMTIGAKNKFHSGPEVFMHEFMHALIEKALRDPRNRKLKERIKELRDDSLANNDFTIFLDPSIGHTAGDIATAKEMWEYSHQRTDSEFLAFALTNESVSKAVDKLDMSSYEGWNAKPTSKAGKKVVSSINEFNRALRFDKKGNTELVRDLYKDLLIASKEAELDKAEVLGKKTLDKVEGMEEWVIGKVDKVVGGKETIVDGRKFVDKGWAGKLLKGISDSKQLQYMKSVTPLYDSLLPAITDTASDFNSEFFMLFNHTKKEINKGSVDTKAAVKASIEANMGMAKVPDAERIAIRRVLLDTDITGATTDIDDIVKLLGSTEEVDRRIATIVKTAELSKGIAHKIEMLGIKMATGVHVDSSQAINIGEIIKGKSLSGSYVELNVLASLYAMKYTDKANKDLAVKAIKGHREAVEDTVQLYDAHMRELMETVYLSREYLFEKGWKQDGYSNKKKLEIVKRSDIAKMKKLGFKLIRSEKNEELSLAMGTDMFDMVGADFTAARMEGVISTINLHAEGMSLKKIMQDAGKTAKQIAAGLERAAKVEVKLERDANGLIKLDGLAPRGILVRDAKGKVIDIKYRLPYEDRVKFLGMDADVVETVATTASNISHREASIKTNMQAIDYLLEFKATYFEEHKKDFIYVRPSSVKEIGAGKEYEFAGAWDKIPHYTKQYLGAVNKGEEGIWVHRDHMNNTFGYDKLSIAKFEALKKSPMMTIIATKMEAIIQEVVKYNKFVTIILSPAVVFGNHSSNALTTMALAKIGPVDYMKRYKTAWYDIERYLKEVNELKRLEQEEIAKGSKDRESQRKRLARMKDLAIRIKENPMDVLAQDGQHSTLIEDLDIDGVKQKGKSTIKSRDQIRGWVNKAYDKLPESGQKFFDEAYITEDSATRSFITKITTYSDLGSKLVVITKALEDGQKGKELQDTLNNLSSVFVNYGNLDSKYVQYLNDVGGVEYTKFFMRTMPATVRFTAKMPVKIAGFLGANELVEDLTGYSQSSILQSTMDPFNGLINRSMLSHSRDNVDRLENMATPAYINMILD